MNLFTDFMLWWKTVTESVKTPASLLKILEVPSPPCFPAAATLAKCMLWSEFSSWPFEHSWPLRDDLWPRTSEWKTLLRPTPSGQFSRSVSRLRGRLNKLLRHRGKFMQLWLICNNVLPLICGLLKIHEFNSNYC